MLDAVFETGSSVDMTAWEDEYDLLESETVGISEQQLEQLDGCFGRADLDLAGEQGNVLIAPPVRAVAELPESRVASSGQSQEPAAAHTSGPRSTVGRRLALAAGIALICFGLWNLRNAPQPKPLARGLASTPVAGPFAEPENQFELVPVAIETVRLGMRGAGQNPLSWQVSTEPEPTPETHREVRFEMRKASGKRLWMRFIWPLEQIASSGAQLGTSIHFDLEEMGVHGMATCTFIGPCPEIQSGPGNVVTGMFEHETDPGSKIFTIDLADGSSIAGVTGEHPIWSVTDGDFVAAEHLRPGTMLLTRAGPVAIDSVTNRVAHPDERVYNLQIHGQHVYQVTAGGVLVHNTYGPKKTVIIGENMKRVNQYADRIGGETIDGWLAGRKWTQELNDEFIATMKAQGREIKDIGPDFSRRLRNRIDPSQGRPPSSVYGAERSRLARLREL